MLTIADVCVTFELRKYAHVTHSAIAPNCWSNVNRRICVCEPEDSNAMSVCSAINTTMELVTPTDEYLAMLGTALLH